MTAVWLLPFYPSPLRDDGYDIADYTNVHPDYGTRRDFRTFVREAHKRGLRVITELVINHTSDQHPWFGESRSARDNPKRDWYVWSGRPGALRRGADHLHRHRDQQLGLGPAFAAGYYWHRFFSHQPDLNYDNPAVVRAILRVMRFWLDMGVDGLRLDAVPYLVEREGTNSENLPETHGVLKRLRAALDKRYHNRMLLAEANQWPPDVRPYFGDGDECHMAFHFPLMPRIWIALRKEDRTPIVEIMESTPPIPEDCQWALFLRNHDELTLEMVTDEERDYMWSEYAADKRARINLGIRRRLAPLVDNSRRRIELLNSLLLSMPGTPVIYYGDEIGMGDNVYLGDRNGVRTPMQWTPDRNAGFSIGRCGRALLAGDHGPGLRLSGRQRRGAGAHPRLAPAFHAPHHQHAARATRPSGAARSSSCIRRTGTCWPTCGEHEGVTMLCVANLSRFSQYVELDLSRFVERVPVEMMGRVRFPAIGGLPYLLTFGPHGFYWFELTDGADGAE